MTMAFPSTEFSNTDLDSPWVFSESGTGGAYSVSGGLLTLTHDANPNVSAINVGTQTRPVERPVKIRASGATRGFFLVTPAVAGTPYVSVAPGSGVIPLIPSPVTSPTVQGRVRVAYDGTTYGLQESLIEGDFDIQAKCDSWGGTRSWLDNERNLTFYIRYYTGDGSASAYFGVAISVMGASGGPFELRIVRTNDDLQSFFDIGGGWVVKSNLYNYTGPIVNCYIKDDIKISASGDAWSKWDYIKAA